MMLQRPPPARKALVAMPLSTRKPRPPPREAPAGGERRAKSTSASSHALQHGEETAALRAEAQRLTAENTRLRGALEELGGQKQRLETALEECMDLLLQVSSNKQQPQSPPPNPLADSAMQQTLDATADVTAPTLPPPVADWETLVRQEREAHHEEVARLRHDMETMRTGYESAVADLRTVVAREKQGRHIIEELRTQLERLQTSAEMQTAACERAADDITNLHRNLSDAASKENDLKGKLEALKGKIAEQEDNAVHARLETAQLTAALTEEREKHCQTKLRLNALEQQTRPMACLAADTHRIREQMLSRRSTSNQPWSLSPSPELQTPSPGDPARHAHHADTTAASGAVKAISFSSTPQLPTPIEPPHSSSSRRAAPTQEASSVASPTPRVWGVAGWSGLNSPVEAV